MAVVPRSSEFALRTRSPRKDKDVLSWAWMLRKNNNLIVYKTGNVVDDAHVHDVIKPYVFYRA